jgi:hypothetical protein
MVTGTSWRAMPEGRAAAPQKRRGEEEAGQKSAMGESCIGAPEDLQRRHVDAEDVHEQITEGTPGEGIAKIVGSQRQPRIVDCARHAQTPVEPKPPAPRVVSLVVSASETRACTTGVTTSWATRMPRSMTKSASPRLMSSTFTSPR